MEFCFVESLFDLLVYCVPFFHCQVQTGCKMLIKCDPGAGQPNMATHWGKITHKWQKTFWNRGSTVDSNLSHRPYLVVYNFKNFSPVCAKWCRPKVLNISVKRWSGCKKEESHTVISLAPLPSGQGWLHPSPPWASITSDRTTNSPTMTHWFIPLLTRLPLLFMLSPVFLHSEAHHFQ